MSLRIKKIELKNFKAYEHLVVDANHDFNIIIGANNVGKTTLFEALLLWKKCYHHLISADGRNFYTSDSNHYINFSDLYFMRATSDKDIFNGHGPLSIVITLYDTEEPGVEFCLGVDLTKPKSIANSYLRLKHMQYLNDYKKFVEYLKRKRIKTSEAFFIYQTKPISTILKHEPFMNNAQILKKISVDKSHEVLRNKILKCDESDGTISEGRFEKLTILLRNILDEEYSLIKACGSEEEYVKILVQKDGHSIDISLMGSGFLQVLEIFSTLDYIEENKYGLKIMLIDEPDSHIHASLQKSLLQTLRSIHETQIFVISHNDRFVNQAKNGELFYIDSSVKESGSLKPISEIEDLNKVKTELGGTILALEKLSEAKKIIFVEGKDDIEYITLIIQKYNELFEDLINIDDYVFFGLRGRGQIAKKVEYTLRFVSQLSREKVIGIIYDKDFSTQASLAKIHNKLNQHRLYDFDFSHKGYCIESAIFNDPTKLGLLIAQSIKEGSFGSSYDIASEFVVKKTREVFDQYVSDMNDLNSEIIKDIEKKFISQSTEERPENDGVSFNDFWRECLENNDLSFVLNKKYMEKLIDDIMRRVYPFHYDELPIKEIYQILVSNATAESWESNWTKLLDKIRPE